MKIFQTVKNHASKLAVGVGAMASSAVALATTAPASQGAAAITALEAEATTMIDAAWPVATLIVGAMIAIKLFKKFANKAS